MEAAPGPLAAYYTKTVQYKTIDGCDILADILIAHGLRRAKHPVIINWHGGALVMKELKIQ